MIEIKCPVCSKLLTVNSNASLIYSCETKQEWVPSLKITLDVVDATYYLLSNNEPVVKVIEIPPYKFIIKNAEDDKYTEVREIYIPDHSYSSDSKWMFDTKRLLYISAVMDAPWHDREKVLEKLKSYLLLS